MHKVLVPYDGSEHSRCALEFVLDQRAAARPAEVHLLNVRERTFSHEECTTTAPIDDLDDAEMALGRKTLDPAAKRVAAAGLLCQIHFVLGNLGHAAGDPVAFNPRSLPWFR